MASRSIRAKQIPMSIRQETETVERISQFLTKLKQGD